MTKKDYEPLLRDGWRKDESYVFVSYSSQDWDKVYPCVLELRARGINVFIDVEFQENSSSNWLRNLEDRLIQDDECKGIVAFVSIGYLGSYACLTELIANRTYTQRKEKGGNPLPVFYIALDEALSTPQKMSQHIYDKAVKKELRSYIVKMESEECTTLENYLLDCRLPRYPDRESIRHLLMNPIKTKFNVAATMCDLIFSDVEMMPSIQLFASAAECAELLLRNFVNDKNESIELPVLEDLRQETLARLSKPVEKTTSLEPVKTEVPNHSESPKPVQPPQIKAPAEEDARAQFNRGMCYAEGKGVGLDWKQAVYWFRKAADQGFTAAQYNLGICYDKGWGVEQDWKQAAYWFRKAADQGDASAQYNLGISYENGEGVEQDQKQAIYWYRKAADLGHANAQYNLGICYDNGQGVEQDWKQAVYWYRKAADQGDASSQNNLGVCYKRGKGVEQDWKQAAYWYRRAADQGYATAQHNLGVCYDNGEGVEQNWKQAVYWYRKAAEQGSVEAQYNLGICYDDGKGVEQDLKQAVYWYRKAADQGYIDAQYNLAICYKNGRGVERNLKQAAYWYRKAAEQGDADAKKALDRLADDGLSF